MKIIDRVILAGFAVAVLIGGYLAGHQTQEVNVAPPKPATITATVDEGPFTYVATYVVREVCDELGGTFFESAGYGKTGDCVYVANQEDGG